MNANVSVDVREDVAIVRVEGSITLSFAREIQEAIDSVFERGPNKAIIDLSKVKYMDSTGLGLLVSLYTRFYKKNGEVVLLQPIGRVRDLLMLTKVSSVFYIAESEADALNHLQTA